MPGNIVEGTTVQFDAKVYKIHPDAVIPTRQSKEAAGFDLCTLEDFSLWPGESCIVKTGLVIRPPVGYHTELLIRSSLSYKYNIMLRNSVGLIDRDYAGEGDELKLMFYRCPTYDGPPATAAPTMSWEAGQSVPAAFKSGDRVAQLIFRETILFNCLEVPDPPLTGDRGGLGSTGV